ncbi:MAG: HTH-type transcriptional regulator ImmR [Candidatus Dichloromethanomonas elyunquensis]|nr:MAG: HTH-type transcriptional regulator ImmR [Candidatus Dichloromethanomonas elyunquensis]
MQIIEKVPIYLKNTLRSLRIKFNYTQEKAASLLDISVPTLRNWERDSSNVPYHMIERFEKIYGTSQDYIFFGDEVAFSELIRSQTSQSA